MRQQWYTESGKKIHQTRLRRELFLDYVEKSLKSLPRQGFRAEKWNCTNR